MKSLFTRKKNPPYSIIYDLRETGHIEVWPHGRIIASLTYMPLREWKAFNTLRSAKKWMLTEHMKRILQS